MTACESASHSTRLGSARELRPASVSSLCMCCVWMCMCAASDVRTLLMRFSLSLSLSLSLFFSLSLDRENEHQLSVDINLDLTPLPPKRVDYFIDDFQRHSLSEMVLAPRRFFGFFKRRQRKGTLQEQSFSFFSFIFLFLSFLLRSSID